MLKLVIAVSVSASPEYEIGATRIDAVLAFDRIPDLDMFTAPTLVLRTADKILNPPNFSEELARRILGAELFILEKGGQLASEVVRKQFNAAEFGFFARHS